MYSNYRSALLGALCLAAMPLQANAQSETIVVNGRSVTNSGEAESASAQDVSATVNVANTEDALKYLPDVLVRKRHIGDTQAPISTRTSGVGSSARSLVYADGVLLSALIGNNNSFASPRWGMVAPDDIERINVLYGPFSAAYPGNSIGSVIEITTRMPDKFEINGKAETAFQDFSQYATSGTYASYEADAGMADRYGPFAFRFSANYLNSHSQPLAYVTLTRPSTTSAAGTPVTGSFSDLNRTGAAIEIIGAGGLEYQRQENITLKLTYDVSQNLKATYTLGLFHQDDDSDVQTYLKDGSGNPLYSGSVNINGYNYNIAASSFSNNLYNFRETHLMQALSLVSDDGPWSWSVIGSMYNFASDIQRIPTTVIPAARSGGAGTITKMNGTGWYTLDAKGGWNDGGAHTVSFGAHRDEFTLANNKYNTADWIHGAPTNLATSSSGRTATNALWLQDVWNISDAIQATVGGRYENWQAYDGANYSLSPTLSVKQPELSGNFFSPKASLTWLPAEAWSVTGSFGIAYRMPTVSELYQAVTTGATLTVPNPNLKPERASSFDLSIVRELTGGKVRFSTFQEDTSNALISQSAPLVSGSTTLFNYVQNIDHVRSRGAELVWDKTNVLDDWDLSGSVTYVDSRIAKDTAFAAATGKQTPQIPKWRATAVVTYRPSDLLSLSVAARYSDRVYATIDNIDTVTHTFQGFDPYLVFDTRAQYAVDENWSLAAGIDNIGNRKYFLFHPFPQRTFFVELKYAQ